MPHAAVTTTAAPFAKLVELGDQLVGAWAGAVKRQQRDFETGDPVFKRDDPSKQALEEVNWFIAMPGTTAKLGPQGGPYETIEPGATVRWSFSGFKWGQVIDARKGLPAVADFKIKAGGEASSDVYTIKLIGYSVATENPAGAEKAGFTVVDKRIVMRSEEEREKWVLAMMRQGQKNLNAANDFEVTARRADFTAEAQWVALADELWLSKPWEAQAAVAEAPIHAADGAPHPAEAADAEPDEEPF
jgi:hypothetical protein